MQLIAVDIGNSSTKIAVENIANRNLWRTRANLDNRSPVEFGPDFLGFLEHQSAWSISSVNETRQSELVAWIKENRPEDRVHIIGESDVPMGSNVESREQLGRDRLIAAWAAWQLNDCQGPLIVVDAGTAVTIDGVDPAGTFQGGFIFPGAEANLKSLNEKTHDLPDLTSENREQTDFQFSLGKSTISAILNGVNQSQIHAMTGMVGKLKTHLGADNTKVFATGGGLNLIHSELPTDWIFVDDLVLRGALGIGKQMAISS